MRIRKPAFWAIRAGLVRAPRWAPMWVRYGGHETRQLLSKMLDAILKVR